MKKLIFAFLILTTVWAGNAYCGTSSGVGTITELWLSEDGNAVRVKFSEDIKNPQSCGAKEFYIKELDESAGSNRFYSTLLAAHSAKKQVDIWVHGCTSKAFWGHTRPYIHSIAIVE